MNEDITVVPSDVDVDDVEAHGIREVMVGLSAAAVLTGGVAAVVTAGDSPGSTNRASISADALGTDLGDTELAASSSDSTAKLDSAAGSAATSATSRKAGAVTAGDAHAALADSDDVSAPTFLGRTLERTDDIVDDGVSWAREVRGDAVDTTRATARTARDAVRDARTTVRNAPATAVNSVQQAQTTSVGELPSVNEVLSDTQSVVSGTVRSVDATIELAGDLVRGIEGTATTLVASIQPSVGSGIDLESTSGWVTISVGGEEIARAQVREGQATVSYQAPRADMPVTVSFTGNDLVSAPSITL